MPTPNFINRCQPHVKTEANDVDDVDLTASEIKLLAKQRIPKFDFRLTEISRLFSQRDRKTAREKLLVELVSVIETPELPIVALSRLLEIDTTAIRLVLKNIQIN